MTYPWIEDERGIRAKAGLPIKLPPVAPPKTTEAIIRNTWRGGLTGTGAVIGSLAIPIPLVGTLLGAVGGYALGEIVGRKVAPLKHDPTPLERQTLPDTKNLAA